MAQKEFILQGFTQRTHADAVRELFDISDIKRVIVSVAFVSESGVEEIEQQLSNNANRLSVFAGIRNDITSKQGLDRLFNISGSELYIVDTGSRTVIFHPKLYFVRGEEQARLILGSANLTLGGLNNNIEASILVRLDLSNSEDESLADEIEAQFAALPKDYSQNVIKIGATSEIDALLESGRLVDEMAVPPPRPATSSKGTGASDVVPRIKLKVKPLRRTLAKARAAATKSKTLTAVKVGKPDPALVPASIGVEFELVWESKPLTERDLNVPRGSNTHATGSINLDKGLLPDTADQRHYFRDVVFSGLNWTPTNATGKVEEAFAKFQLVIKGISYGEFNLRIGHSTDTTSKTYLQNNAMTRLSWGPVREYVARTDLIDRTLALYRDEADPTRFVLEID